jgi:hypothetical protein
MEANLHLNILNSIGKPAPVAMSLLLITSTSKYNA